MAERNERAYEKVIEHIKSEIWPPSGSWPSPWG